VERAVALDPRTYRVAAPGLVHLPADCEWRTLRRPTLRSQLNQIRLWLRQGRTEAWIAHKLDISVATLEQFKREQRLGTNEVEPEPRPDAVAPGGPEAPVGPAPDGPEAEAPAYAERPEPDGGAETSETDAVLADNEAASAGPVGGELREEDGEEEPSDEEDAGRSRRRRRGRRGGRRRRAKRPQYEATFEHGEDGYELRLDPAVADNPVYAKHWAGQRTVAVTLDPDAITIRRVEEEQERDEEPRD
jgi:hypothetical protein